jgi:hypothetical protein
VDRAPLRLRGLHARLRSGAPAVDWAALGYGYEPLCVVSVGGSGVGASLLQRALESLAIARERVPDLRTLVVTGPRIDPASLPRDRGVEVVGYVHELWRHLASATSPSSRAASRRRWSSSPPRRPFVAIPLASHFEQQFHVRHGWIATARAWHVQFTDATPERLGGLIGRPHRQRAVVPARVGRRARRARAELIAELL